MLEPDSLPNLATNQYAPKCSAASSGYKQGIADAIKALSPLGTIYLDAGWSGWIGTWAVEQMAKLISEVIALAGPSARVRGFITNVSNYGGTASESDYALNLLNALKNMGHTGLKFLIDTSRNGRGQQGSWCNARNAGIGQPPTTKTGFADADALLWVKPPGESDGTSDPRAKRYDPECGKSAALPNAPEAGDWFHDQFVMLVETAEPGLSNAPTYVSATLLVSPSPPPSPPSPLPRPPLVLSPPSPQPCPLPMLITATLPDSAFIQGDFSSDGLPRSLPVPKTKRKPHSLHQSPPPTPKRQQKNRTPQILREDSPPPMLSQVGQTPNPRQSSAFMYSLGLFIVIIIVSIIVRRQQLLVYLNLANPSPRQEMRPLPTNIDMTKIRPRRVQSEEIDEEGCEGNESSAFPSVQRNQKRGPKRSQGLPQGHGRHR